MLVFQRTSRRPGFESLVGYHDDVVRADLLRDGRLEPLALGALHRPGNVCCQRLKLGSHFEGALQAGGGGSWRAFWPSERCAFMDTLLDFDQSQLERQVDHLQLLLPLP